jgi:integrase
MKLALDARQIGGTLTFESYARSWVESYVGRTSRGLASSTRASYARSTEHYLIPFFKGRALAGITPMDVRALIATLEARKQALTSIRKNVAPLKCMMATALEEGLIATNPARHVRINTQLPQQLPQQGRPMTRAQLDRLLAEIPAKHRLFFAFLAHTGVRISEAVGLQWEDLTLVEPAHVSIRRQIYRGQPSPLKSHAARRTIPLSRGMAQALSKQAEGHLSHDGASPVFTTSAGTPIDCQNLRTKVLAPAAQRAGITRVGFHTFRHTCASVLYEGGKTTRQVAAWLGHANPAYTLKTYVHLLDDGLGDADFLDKELKLVWPWT